MNLIDRNEIEKEVIKAIKCNTLCAKFTCKDVKKLSIFTDHTYNSDDKPSYSFNSAWYHIHFNMVEIYWYDDIDCLKICKKVKPEEEGYTFLDMLSYKKDGYKEADFPVAYVFFRCTSDDYIIGLELNEDQIKLVLDKVWE